MLDLCSFKVNQRLLLRDLFISNIASPFLLAPVVLSQTVSGLLSVPPVATPAVQPPLLSPTTTSSLTPVTATSTSLTTTSSAATSSSALGSNPSGGDNKLKSNVFNNSVPPRKRPPIPSNTGFIKKDLAPGGIGVGDVATPAAATAVVEAPVKVEIEDVIFYSILHMHVDCQCA